MTLLKERLKEAVEKKENNVKEFVWLYPRNYEDGGKQDSVRLIDCTQEQLREFYNHCNTMLYNESKDNPGRKNVLKSIYSQLDSIGVELMLREFEDKDPTFDRFAFAVSIEKYLDNNPDIDPKVASIKHFMAVPRRYEDLSLELIKDGCMDKLGIFDKTHITRSFILRLGIWFNDSKGDYKKLEEYAKINKINDPKIMSIARKYLRLKEYDKLKTNPNGLSLTAMRSMLRLTRSKRYRDLTDEQLNSLRYRVLFELARDVKEHIAKWEQIKSQIEAAAEYKNYKLV